MAFSLTAFCCLKVLASLSNQFSVTKSIHFLWGTMAIDISGPADVSLPENVAESLGDEKECVLYPILLSNQDILFYSCLLLLSIKPAASIVSVDFHGLFTLCDLIFIEII